MTPQATRLREVWLLAATFIIAVAGLIYELVAATVSSYLLGDSVRQFSLVIGVFLFSMGLGAWASKYIAHPMRGFIWAQISLGIAGGAMAPLLFFTYAWTGEVGLMLYGLLVVVGMLSGMEIPLIARVLQDMGAGEFRFENVLTVDYVGALAASLAFPLLVIPHLGLMSASLAFGCLNLLVAGLSLWLFRDQAARLAWGVWAVALVVSVAGLVGSERLVSAADAALFEDDVILSETTPYQQITLTKFRDRVRLYLDHSIQFDSADEHRYHETLVHPAMGLAPRRDAVLILGGGDGMALREVLRHGDVKSVTLVDLDPRVTQLFRDHPQLAPLNGGAFNDLRVTVINRDAWQFAEGSSEIFDVIIADLPDPKNLALSKLYSREFYSLLFERLSGTGVMVTQAGSPLFARQAFWTVEATLADTESRGATDEGLWTLPYHSYVPSFGLWGFVIAAPTARQPRDLVLPEGLRYLTPEVWQTAQVFAPDTARVAAEPNNLQTHPLVAAYLDGWDAWFR